MRGTIIYITTVVVLITIVGQGLLLPVLMKKINAQGKTNNEPHQLPGT